MTVQELIDELKKYPEDSSVEICTPWGSFEVSNLGSEISASDGEEIVLIVSERNPIPPEIYGENITVGS